MMFIKADDYNSGPHSSLLDVFLPDLGRWDGKWMMFVNVDGLPH